MKQLFPLYGIVPALNIPFDEKDNVDTTALRAQVEEALRAGVAGFLVPVMASEVQKLSFHEKMTIVEHVLDQTAGRAPVFAGCATASVDESKKLMRAYLGLGCRHVLIQLPFMKKSQFFHDFMTLAEEGAEVIMLQDWDAAGYGLPDDLIVGLFDKVPAFRCLKIETVPAGIKYTRILELTEGRLNVSGGWAVTQMPEGLMRGVHAFMPTGMHWIYTRIFDLYKNGDEAGAVSLFHEILPVLAFSNQHLDISIRFFKRLLWRQGIYPTPHVREPLLPFDDVHTRIADELIEKIMEIEEKLKGGPGSGAFNQLIK